MLSFWNGFSIMIRFKGTNDYSISKESMDSPWYDMAIEIHKISLLDTSKQIVTESRFLSDCVLDTLEHPCQYDEYKIG